MSLTLEEQRSETPSSDRLPEPRAITEQQWPGSTAPLVSICCITYNQDKFIAECIEGFLSQETTFPVEIIIHDDASTDATAEILRAYRAKYPKLFRLILQKKNQFQQGKRRILMTMLPCSQGQYIAMCEGDDYWTDKRKLEIQISEFMNDSKLAISFHNAMVRNTRNGGHSERVFHADLKQEIFYTKDLLCQWFIPTASIVFRKYDDFQLPDWYYQCQSGDIPLLLLLSLRGHIKYIDKVMSTYRLHDEGISMTHFGYAKVIGMVYMYQCFNVYTNYLFAKKIEEAIIYEIRKHLPDLQTQSPKPSSLVRRIFHGLKRKLRRGLMLNRSEH